MLKTIHAVVRNGKIELLEPIVLPDGAQVLVTILTEDEQAFWQAASAEADNLDREVEQLRNSIAFQRFLDERSAYQTAKRRIPLDVIRREIEAELAAQQSPEPDS